MIELASNSTAIMNNYFEIGHPCLFPLSSVKTLHVQLLITVLSVLQ